MDLVSVSCGRVIGAGAVATFASLGALMLRVTRVAAHDDGVARQRLRKHNVSVLPGVVSFGIDAGVIAGSLDSYWPDWVLAAMVVLSESFPSGSHRWLCEGPPPEAAPCGKLPTVGGTRVEQQQQGRLSLVHVSLHRRVGLGPPGGVFGLDRQRSSQRHRCRDRNRSHRRWRVRHGRCAPRRTTEIFFALTISADHSLISRTARRAA